MKVRRVIEITGPKTWVELTLEKSYVQPDHPIDFTRDGTQSIREVSREVVEE